eukprot:TRINITY_DN5471_c0_g3_i1.p1 TRINITY_DN5471_c0_g3~~TRINITY_DN5471_c0_g3_i1.p1  ORF type:complete len:1135 (+),score=234.75 TRINITY_DN5471_c0_g3_i1:40-3405(+)
MSGFLQLEVLRAEDLPAKDWCTSDPYVVVTFGCTSNMQEKQTTVKSCTLNPVWNSLMQFKAINECDKLVFLVYDHDAIGEHDYMCEGHIWVGTATHSSRLYHQNTLGREKALEKLKKHRQLGIESEHPAGDQLETIVYLYDRVTQEDRGKLHVRWVYTYSNFGGLLTARLDEVSLKSKTRDASVEEFSLEVLQSNIDRIKKRVKSFLGPLDFLNGVVSWDNPPESFLAMLLAMYLVKKDLLIPFIPFALGVAMLRNWYLWWRWGPAGPPTYEMVTNIDDSGETNIGGSASQSQTVDDNNEWLLTRLKRMGSEIQEATGKVVSTLDDLNSVVMWKHKKHAFLITLTLFSVSAVLAVPYLGDLLSLILTPILHYFSTITMGYLFTFYPLYKQFPYIAKYYKIGDLIGLMVSGVELTLRGLPTWVRYNSATKKAREQMKKKISIEMQNLLNTLDTAVQTNPCENVMLCLRHGLYNEERDLGMDNDEHQLVHDVFTRGNWGFSAFVQGSRKLKNQHQKAEIDVLNDQPVILSRISDAMKMELAQRGKWLDSTLCQQVFEARKSLIKLELQRAEREKSRIRVRKYGDALATAPRLTVNILSCKNLSCGDGEVRKISNRITWVSVTLSGHCLTTDKKKHPVAPQFNSQIKFGFDDHGRDAFYPNRNPYLRVEVHEEGRNGPLGWFEEDIRKFPRRLETPEKYFTLRRIGNEVVGEISCSFYAECFGTETLVFDTDVASRLSCDRVLQRMYWETVSNPTSTVHSDQQSVVYPQNIVDMISLEHLTSTDIREQTVPAPPVRVSPPVGRFTGLSNNNTVLSSRPAEVYSRSGHAHTETVPVTTNQDEEVLEEQIGEVKSAIEELRKQMEEDREEVARLEKEKEQEKEKEKEKEEAAEEEDKEDIPESVVEEADQVSDEEKEAPTPPVPKKEETEEKEISTPTPTPTPAHTPKPRVVNPTTRLGSLRMSLPSSVPLKREVDNLIKTAEKEKEPTAVPPQDMVSKILREVSKEMKTEKSLGPAPTRVSAKKSTAMPAVVKGYFCDGCQSQYIRDYRHNSLDDPEYDLCTACFTHHSLLGLVDPSRYVKIPIPTRSLSSFPYHYNPETGLTDAETSLARYQATRAGFNGNSYQ